MFFSRKKADGEKPVVIIGLGNPGTTYEKSRHNVGFLAVDAIARKLGIDDLKQKTRFKAQIGEGNRNGQKIVLVKPQTYMNLSGEAVVAVCQFYKPDLSRVIVIYDDVDIVLGAVRVRPFGSSGTHNGMRSVTELLGTEKFPRIRIGIGQPPDYMDIRDFVLTRFAEEESVKITEAVAQAAGAALDIVALGVEQAMNLHNRKQQKEKQAAKKQAPEEQAATQETTTEQTAPKM